MMSKRIAVVNIESYGNSDRCLAIDNLCGSLRAHTDHKIESINTARCTFEWLIHKLRDFSPDMLCLSIRPGGRAYFDRLLDSLSQIRFKGQIVLGGLSVSASPDLFLSHIPHAIAVVGEGEEAIVSLAKSDFSDTVKLSKIPNLVFWGKDGLVYTEKRVVPDKYLSTSFEDAEGAISSGGVCWVESSRSCSYSCTYCSNSLTHFTSKWRPLPLSLVMGQLDALANKGASIVSFADMNTFEDLDRLIELEKLFADKPPSLKIRFDVRSDSIFNPKDSKPEAQRRFEALRRLRKSGLVQVFIGYESPDSTQLQRFRKGVSSSNQDIALGQLKQLGIDYVLGYMLFDPMMQLEELIPNLDALLSLDLLKHISTPLKQTRVQRGTSLEITMNNNGLLGSLQDNYIYYDYQYNDIRLIPIAHIANYFYYTSAKVYRHSYITSMLRCMGSAHNLQKIFEDFSYRFKLIELSLLRDSAVLCLRGDSKLSLISLVEDYKQRRLDLFLSLKDFYKSLLCNDFPFFQMDMSDFCGFMEEPAQYGLTEVEASDIIEGNLYFQF